MSYAHFTTTEGNFVAPQSGMIFDPASGNSAGTNRKAIATNGQLNVLPSVPASMTKLLAYLPQPNSGGPNAIADNYVGTGKQTFQNDQGDARIDYAFNPSVRIFGRYTISQFTNSAPGAFGDLGPGFDSPAQFTSAFGRHRGRDWRGLIAESECHVRYTNRPYPRPER